MAYFRGGPQAGVVHEDAYNNKGQSDQRSSPGKVKGSPFSKMDFSNDLFEPCSCSREKFKGRSEKVLNFQDAPTFLKFNPYITSGYRHCLNPQQCLQSMLWWTNETVNIWSHVVGFAYFSYVFVRDLILGGNLVQEGADFYLYAFTVLCFQACMMLSSLYHIFCCSSDKSYHRWLSADLFGVSLSIIAIYVTGIYLAFHNQSDFFLNLYIGIVVSIYAFVIASCVFFDTAFEVRLIVFGLWAAFGVIPTFHWAVMLGFDSPIVQWLLPKIIWMYIASTAAFLVYIVRFPERVVSARIVNYVGSSHNLWHFLVFIALSHWQQVVLASVTLNGEYKELQSLSFNGTSNGGL